ncbi:cation-binding hemerythrin HHE [Nitrogeniibacter mangrovi]|uniref:Cation-binding hemerythrin HHE n=1 Tax=Nitrogeniibacter mangrovi TaxID=2016596 RepID=A0A6C1B690_9RHOO|nr:hemerythrin domain-containing protein [Nitrogeniibacter mangrovi]QID18559.1 cation-binding hemerythrin HHE [Nitrogeniibacter mangrovi]
MKRMEWNDTLELGLAPMDATHREFVECYNALAEAPEADFIDCLDAFIAHTVEHFEQENRWMAAVNFPGCHKAEHDRVLTVLRDVRRLAAAGDMALGRRLVEELPPWFENHASGMDAALAFHLETIGFDTGSGDIAHPEKLSGVSCSTAEGSACG